MMSPEEARAQRAQQRILNESNVQTPVPGASSVRNSQFHTAYSHTLFGQAGTFEKPAWSDSTKGRAAIRLISRGIVGAAFFTIGGRFSRHHLEDYSPETFSFKTAQKKPLQFIAKGFDVVFGKSISEMTRLANRAVGRSAVEAEEAAFNAVHFRDHAYFNSVGGLLDANNRPRVGRSLGAEMVGITFDFAMASIGDSSTRNLIQMIDPNIRKTYMVNDRGETAQDGERSHFDLGKFGKFAGSTVWRILSNNQGEDWFAGLPYVYQMKAQRSLMTHMFAKDLKGAKIMFDNNWFGGAYKVNNAGQIIGDYQLAGAMDLHTRFVGYNVYTLIFRENYDAIAKHFKHWKESGYHLDMHLPKHPLSAVGHGMTDSVRYLAKSFIKANLYMNPAVIPFWMMRAPQTKWRGGMINVEAAPGENALMSRISWNERVEKNIGPAFASATDEEKKQLIKAMEKKLVVNGVHNYGSEKDRVWNTGHTAPFNEKPVMYAGRSATEIPNPSYPYKNPYQKGMYKDYEPGINTTFSKALNPLGEFSYWVGEKASLLPQFLPKGKIRKFLEEDTKTIPGLSNVKASQFMHNFVDASFSYTPYMFAKAETALRVDDRTREGGGKMDKAIYKLIDNVCVLNGRAAKDAVKEIWNLSMHHERELSSREWSQSKPDAATPPIPATTVQAEGRALHDPASLSRADEAHDKTDRNWAESVAGRNLAGQFQAPSPIRH